MIFPRAERTNTQMHKYSIWRSARKTQHVGYFWREDCSRISKMIFQWVKQANTKIQDTNIHDICHRYHRSYLWRKNLSCGEISDFSTSVMWRNLKLLHIHHVEKNQIYPHDRCGQSELSPHDGCGAIPHFSTWQMRRIWVFSTWWMWRNFTISLFTK